MKENIYLKVLNPLILLRFVKRQPLAGSGAGPIFCKVDICSDKITVLHY